MPRKTANSGQTRAKPRATDAPRRKREESSVGRTYLALRDRAMSYSFRPGERINEQTLAKELGVSRAPLREALNRLVAEGMLEFVMNRGFYRKAVSVEEVYNLYQVRIALERRAVLLAIDVATEQEVIALRDYWDGVMRRRHELSIGDLLLADEEFHRRMVALSRNPQLAEFLEIVSRRIHVARHIDLQRSDWNERAFAAHSRLVQLIAARDTETALATLSEHIGMSLKRAVEITKEMAARFFVVGLAAESTSARASEISERT